MKTEVIEGYGVEIRGRLSNDKWLAVGENGNYFNFNRSETVRFKTNLREHLPSGTKLRVVKVKVRYSWQ